MNIISASGEIETTILKILSKKTEHGCLAEVPITCSVSRKLLSYMLNSKTVMKLSIVKCNWTLNLAALLLTFLGEEAEERFAYRIVEKADLELRRYE
ncbi:hypothetical protein NPIL_375681 [Nephila pilipes]|uniref:Uncharacterized protein n=1 Tax=Nephila pilipes TaxID=299642 RepID=A0A8X6T582_NEPPI|nr:hypothetical protein NPIL_375681 [Nephila pilipes]